MFFLQLIFNENNQKLELNKRRIWEVTLVNACGGRNVVSLRDSSTLHPSFTQLHSRDLTAFLRYI